MTKNTFMENLTNLDNVTLTENGAKAYKSTLNHNLDFFASSSMYRFNTSRGVGDFWKAFDEDKTIALANLLYLRDIRKGLGLRVSLKFDFGLGMRLGLVLQLRLGLRLGLKRRDRVKVMFSIRGRVWVMVTFRVLLMLELVTG